MSDTVEQIKSRLDIVDVISGYLKLQKAGANYKARCPFHNEKTPSFHISPERQSWHCFGCNKGGDMFSFVQEIEGVEFVESMRVLATKAGVQLPQWRPDQAREKDMRGALLAVADLAAKFFEKQLWNSNAGAKALEYLRGRGLTDETIKAWRLGWAPNDWRPLTSFLIDQGHTTPDLVGAGMAIDKNGRPYDRFRSRIMFPIADVHGQVAGFTGRVFGAEVAINGEAPAKYVNTPQTAIYDKSRILFGLDKAKVDMRQRQECVLVEGNMDAIMAWQAGVTNTVATSGTALTPQQLQQIGRYSTTLSFCFDTDQAGQVATRRGIALALVQNFTIKVLTITDQECKDPADYVAKYGAKFTEVVAAAKPVLQYYYDAAAASYDPRSVPSKKAIIAAMGPFIKRLPSKVEQSHWTAQLAALLRTDVASVQSDITTGHDDIAAHERAPEAEQKPIASSQQTGIMSEPVDPHSQELLGLVVRWPELLPDVQNMPVELLDPRIASLVQNPSLLDPASEHEHRHLVDMASMRAQEVWQDWKPEDARAELTLIINQLRVRHVRHRNMQLGREIEQAEIMKDPTRRDVLIQEFQQNTHELNQLLKIITTS